MGREEVGEVLFFIRVQEKKVYSVSVHKGLINQIEHLGRSFSAKNTELLKPNDIVYTKSPTGEFPLWDNKTGQKLIKM